MAKDTTSASSDVQAAVPTAPAAAPMPVENPPADTLVTVANRKNYQIPMKVLEHGKAVEVIVPPHGRVQIYNSQVILPMPAGLLLVGA